MISSGGLVFCDVCGAVGWWTDNGSDCDLWENTIGNGGGLWHTTSVGTLCKGCMEKWMDFAVRASVRDEYRERCQKDAELLMSLASKEAKEARIISRKRG